MGVYPSWGYGYWTGGYSPVTGTISAVDRVDFNNDTAWHQLKKDQWMS